jgi:ArsR family transcriptional regulator, virulence genes transcriptional regulator
VPNVQSKNHEHFASEGALLLTAMANAKRLSILALLQDQEHSVGALCAKVGLSQSALSQHLAKLRAAKLVTTRRDAQIIYYSGCSDAVKKILETLDEIVAQPLRYFEA